MMEEIGQDLKSEDSCSDDEASEPPTERWAPLGAPAPDEAFSNDRNHHSSTSNSNESRLMQLEEEQEQLNASLLALTTHFAQVQFRLKQICNASGDEKEVLLKELEEFTFKGCPDIMEAKRTRIRSSVDSERAVVTPEHEAIIEKQRLKQVQLIRQLKEQLEDLERFAYETGDAGLPTSEVMEKQKAIIDQLRNRMELNVDFESLSSEELQWQVDQAVKRLVNPIKIKEQLVQQLQTQITDLERFIDFLQCEGGTSAGNLLACTCCNDSIVDKSNKKLIVKKAAGSKSDSSKSTMIVNENCPVHNAKKCYATKSYHYEQPVKQNSSTSTLMRQALSLIQIYILAQLGCYSRQRFHRNELKRTTQGSHWGDYRASLELAIQKVVEMALKYRNYQKPATLNPCNSDDDDVEDDVFEQCPEELVTVVRKNLCPALRDLLQHGMIKITNSSKAVVSLGCLSSRSKHQQHIEPQDANVHAWDIIAKYYDMKHGKEYSNDTLRKLSQTFNLDNIGGRAVTSKQLLLSTVDSIITTHSRLKRSNDAMFKAFVSAALNHKKLIGWLRMILRTKEIVDEHYLPWSYVVKTNFDDACGSLEKLNAFSFNLPTDFAIRPFQNIKDVF